MTTSNSSCPLCGRSDVRCTPEGGRSNIIDHIKCSTCGRFRVSSGLIDSELNQPHMTSKLHLLSAVTKASTEELNLDIGLIERVANGQIAEKTVDEKIELVLRTYARRSTEIGDLCEVRAGTDYPLAWCHSEKEWKTIVDVLDSDFDYLTYEDPSGKRVRVTVKGWRWLAERPKGKGDVGFIAMAFRQELEPVKEAIERGVREAGYTPLRIDGDEYNGAIVDRILAKIRESRFLVADFKFNRGGVYYEAGFAEGLGLDVFYLCDEAQVRADGRPEDRVHFDIAHLNLITWNRENLDSLSESLKNRIVRVIGRGPVTE